MLVNTLHCTSGMSFYKPHEGGCFLTCSSSHSSLLAPNTHPQSHHRMPPHQDCTLPDVFCKSQQAACRGTSYCLFFIVWAVAQLLYCPGFLCCSRVFADDFLKDLAAFKGSMLFFCDTVKLLKPKAIVKWYVSATTPNVSLFKAKY